MAGIIFTRPEYLMLLLSIPVLVFIYIISLKNTKSNAIKFSNFQAVSRIKGVEFFSKNWSSLFVNILILFLIVFSVSGTSITRNVEASSLSFILAIDASGSMIAGDIEPTRLDAAKQAAVNFLDLVPEQTRIGIVSFSGTPFIEQEVTEDKEKIRLAIENIDIKFVGGTNILGAITTSANLLREEDSKTIILISDGQANLNSLQDIVDYSNDNRVMIHSLGIGTREGAIEEGGITYKISEDTLKTIAYNTDGEYYVINNLQEFYSSLNELIDVTEKRAVFEISLYLMIAALVLFIINFTLQHTRYRTLP